MNYLEYYNKLTYDQIYQDVLVPFLWHFLTYWFGSALFFGIDWYLVKTDQIKKYKIQGEEIIKKGNINWSKYYQTAKYVMFNMFTCTLPVIVMMAPLIDYFELRSESLNQQEWWIILFKFVLMIIISDFIFTFAHYAFHHPKLYKYHKIHHEWIAPVAVRAIYAHPFEHIGANLTSMIIPIYLVKLPFSYFGWWTFVITLNTLKSHSGLRIKFWLLTADDHDLHHKLFNYNYGFTTIWDQLLGTYLSMDEYLEKKNEKKKIEV